MSAVVPTALILGHSFVKRLQWDLHRGFDSRASCDFNVLGTASVRLHDIGGRTVQTLQANDLHVVRDLAPDIVILEIGTVPLETMGRFARGKTSSLPNVVAANSPRWDENRDRGKDEVTESRGELDAVMSR